MNKRQFGKKTIAWSLIAAMLNPVAMLPAYGRDSDIYLSSSASTTTAEPNILITLDTSDSMNLPEAWKEYAPRPGTAVTDEVNYDSHIEYLWNDCTLINCTGTETAAASSTTITTAPPTVLTPAGSWAGATITDRRALWNAAKASAATTVSGDPGPRNIWRNYNAAYWIYWLPAGTPTTDLRLTSLTFNRWAGGIDVLNTTRGGIAYSGGADFRGNNRCGDSGTDPAVNLGTSFGTGLSSKVDPGRTDVPQGLTPSTVYAPSGAPRNSGRYLNTTWMRWERFLDLRNGKFTNGDTTYPTAGVGATTLPASGTYPIGAGSGMPNVGANIRGRAETIVPIQNSAAVPVAEWGLGTGSTGAVRDTYLNLLPFSNFTTIGDRGQPIRTQIDTGTVNQVQIGDSRSGWTLPKADMGGFNLVDNVFNLFNSAAGVVQLQTILGWYGITAPASTVNNQTLTYAWKGNRDASPSFDRTTGTPAYYDSPVTRGTTTRGSTTVTLPAGASGITAGMTVNIPGAGPNGIPLVTNVVSVAATGASLTVGTVANVSVADTPITRNLRLTPNNEHTAFVQMDNDFTLVHDCTADDGTAYNPSSGYLNGRTDRLFNSAYNLSVSTTAYVGHSYTTAGGTRFTGQPAVDTYSTNYLNWKFGPKGPNGNPIGRKTRLQIAKDALTTLVSATDGVRFGLMVFNRTAGCTSTNRGTIDVVASSMTLNLSDNPGFVAGQPITILGAGRGGTNLNTTVTAVTPNVSVNPPAFNLAIAPAASTSVANAQVTANPCSDSVSNDGANVAQRILRMGSNAADLPDYNNRATLNAAINAVTANSRTPLTETLYEAYRYFSGRTPRFGVATTAALGGGTVTQGRDPAAVCTAAGPGCPAIGLYRSPMLNNPNTTTPAGCQKNFVVLITDGGPEDDWAANSDIKRLGNSGTLGAISPRTTADDTNTHTASDQFETGGTRYGPVDLAGATFDGGYIWLDELAYFISRADVSPGALNLPGDTGPDRLLGRQSIVTYTIGFTGGDSPALQNASAHSGGDYYLAEDSASLGAALSSAVAAIRDRDPTAAAATVPISVLNRAENATDVYLAFFQPDPSSAWLGTVKKFNLSSDPTDCGGANKTPCLIGQTVLTKSPPNPSPVKNIETVTDEPITGTQAVAVDINASSLWAPPSITDGGRPNQGGTGYQLINTAGYDPSTRNVYTFISGTSDTVDLTVASNAVKEANTNINKCRLGDAVACITPATPSMTDAARATLINFARGGSRSDGNCSDANPATACTTWRAWPHAAVEHSKPLIVTYDETPTGTPARATSQYLYFLSNDGLLHAVDTFTGKEKWAFLIEEALPQINALMADTAGPENALADGGLSVYQTDDNGDGIVNGGDKVWLYFGLRRGGRAYYALDITLKDAPRFKWKITANSGSGQLCLGVGACAANPDYNELGQTWSAPIVGKIRALGGSVPALIFGGGYDPNQDSVPPAVTADTMGRAVYVVNGETGATVKWFGSSGSVPVAGMNFSIPSDVTALNTDSDAQGFIDRLYVGDTGGNVWRFDIDSATLTLWTGKKLADLSGGTTPKRKIFFAPAAVKRDVPERFDAVYVGTGDREHPLNTQVTPVRSARDAIFMIMDRDVGLSSGPTVATYPTDFVPVANDCLSACVAPADLSSKKGWARDLETACTPDAAGIVRCGEKVVSPPTVFNLKLRFGTYSPTAESNACTPPGEGRLNEIDAVTGGLSNLNSSTGRGYPSASVVIVLGKNVFLVTILDGAPKFQLLGTIGNASKIYWYMEPEQ